MSKTVPHTPGPWIVFFADEDGPNDILPAGRPGQIASVVESEADAHLIAAAPELLEALERCIEDYSLGGDFPGIEYIIKAKAAVAKARGLA